MNAWGGPGHHPLWPTYVNVGRFQHEPIAGYTWDGGPPPDERNFAPTLHFIEISRDRLSGETLGYFGGNGRLAGQLHFPNAIGIDTHGNIFVGEVDTAKRIQKFAPVMAGGG